MNSSEALSYDATLSEYQHQAKLLFELLQHGDSNAQWRVKWMHPRFRGKPISDVMSAKLGMEDAYLLVARESYFDNWQTLAEYVETIQADGPVSRFEKAVEAVVSGDTDTLRTMLQLHPELAQARSTRSHHATLLHYLGANGVEQGRQKTPPHAVNVAAILLDAGANPNALADFYDHESTTMSLLVSSCHPHRAGLQIALAEKLLDQGASLDGQGANCASALQTSLQFGYLDTAEALARRGAPIDNLIVATGLGRLKDMARFLPQADSTTRHKAFALAAQLGQVDVVKQMLDAGVDPNQFNPDGFNGHCTPLHQAVWADHLDTVKLLVERGARLDLHDTLYEGTPLDWANYGKRKAIAEYLRSLKSS